MFDITVNYLAVFVAGVGSMVLGFLWYGPVFGKLWIKLMGFTKESTEEARKKGMTKSYILMFLGSLVMAFVVAHFVAAWGVTDIAGALQFAFWSWLGFIAPVFLGSVLWEGKSWSLYILNAGYYLVNLAMMALVLTFWM